MQPQKFTYSVAQVAPYIHWLYFFHAWDMQGERSRSAEGEELLRAARRRLQSWSGHRTQALFRLCRAASDGDDLLLDGERLPLLRQQHRTPGEPCLCLSDFVPPAGSAHIGSVGLFAASVALPDGAADDSDPYERMLSQTLCDRLAEATAELLHHTVRTRLWGYAPHERLTIEQMLQGRYCGIRPAVGYPSLPDFSLNFLLDAMLHFASIGITLSESGMMLPHASVSGLMLSHPQSRYFSVGHITREQLCDYARRRGLPAERVEGFLRRNLIDGL